MEFSTGLCCQRPDLETAIMGDKADPGTRGRFYLYTRENYKPYETVQEGVNCQWVEDLIVD